MSTLIGRNLISITEILSDKVVATLFFEPSTRTRLSFESAANQLGARIIGFSDPGGTSVQKGESLHDTIVMVSSYSDLIVMRNPKEGSSRYASEVASVPVINAGDGANQHPTQCMLDLYSIRKTQGTLDNLQIAMVGDLKYGRTVHSLVQAMCNFNATFHLVSPQELKLPSSVKMSIKDAGLRYYQYTDLRDIIPTADIIYMTRGASPTCASCTPCPASMKLLPTSIPRPMPTTSNRLRTVSTSVRHSWPQYSESDKLNCRRDACAPKVKV